MEKINDGQNGLITHIMATESARMYKEYQKEKNSEKPEIATIEIGGNMKYKNITIFRNPKASTWYARYRLNDKQIYIAGKTQQEVYNKLKQALNKNKISYVKYTLKLWIEKWLKLYKSNLRARSLLDLNNIIDKIPEALKNKDMKKITSLELNEYIITGVKGERVKAKTYVVLNDIFDKAKKNSVIDSNPFDVINKPKYKPKERYALSLSEENMFIEKIKGNPEYYIFVIAIYQGLRPGELLALEFTDLDFVNMTITVNKSLDEKTDDMEVKNEYSNRVIPLFAKTYEFIKAANTKLKKRITTHTEKTLNEKLKELIKGITKEKISLYNLRHTFITRLGDQNIPEHVIQAWCGHGKGSKVTKETYTHVSKETEIKYINILNK